MKTYLAAATAALVVASPAQADTFNGPFIGIDMGYDHAEAQHIESESYEYVFGTNTQTSEYRSHVDGDSINGLAGGIYAGYDVNLGGPFFAGVEVRAGISAAKYTDSYSGSYESTDTASPELNYADDYSEEASLRAKESFSATARFGYLLNESTGIYVRGGVVQTRFKLADSDGIYVGEDADEEAIIRDSVKDRNVGLLYGAGLETTVAANTSLRIEYNVAQYGSVFNKLYRAIAEDGDVSKSNLTNHQVRLGLSYNF